METSIKETLYEVKTFPVPLKTGSDHNPSSSGIEDKENKFPMGTSVKETLYEEKKPLQFHWNQILTTPLW